MKLLVFLSLISSSFAARITVFEGKTEIEKPFELRDPFQAPKRKRVIDSQQIKGKVSKTVYDDNPSIRNVELADIEITGVVVGASRRAFGKVRGINRVVIIKEGMLVGSNNAEVKAILPGGILLVEKSVNIYGEEEYLETVIPITK